MPLLGINAFSRMIGERPKTVRSLIARGVITRVIKRCDRTEIEADAALDYLAQKYPQLVASKSECNGLAAQRVDEQIVKQDTSEQTVKRGSERGRYIYDNYGK